jgi:hypothetical protein
MARFRSRGFKVSFDAAFDDVELAEARDELTQGRWESTRDLLEGGRRDWDRRTHRMRVLAEAAANTGWVERWQSLDSRNPHAAVLRAQVEVIRVLRSRGVGADAATVNMIASSAADAEATCRRATELAPEDPAPWVALITLARAQNATREELWRRWNEMRARDPYNRDGFHQTLIYLFDVWHGSHAEMYDFAYYVAGDCPAGSPLVVLPLVAHAESYRSRAAMTDASGRVGLQLHWTQPQVNADLDTVLRRWDSAAPRAHAQAAADRNYLLHALIYADRWRQTRPLFEAVGAHVTRIPWSYTGDPESTFLYWRQRVLGADTA